MTIFAKEAWPFVVPFLAAAAVLLALGWPRWALASLVLGLLVLLFFRIPPRRFSGDAAILLSPASGHVTAIDPLTDRSVSSEPLIRIVTFLSVFDVHVQRAPADGTVIATSAREGRKIAAFKPEAGEVNQSRTTVFETAAGDVVAVRQIAGLVARRVVGYLEKGDTVERGSLIGVIKFGSRVDLLVPADYRILVEIGQRVHEGLTPMASRPESPSR